jgi:hypothetical protein
MTPPGPAGCEGALVRNLRDVRERRLVARFTPKAADWRIGAA